MLLERIDIDAHGSLSQVELGPFAEHLNVVYGPESSGKTAIARFIRDSLVERDYPLGMMSSSSGRVVWADRNGLLHCCREQDGTKTGRRSVEFESRGNASQHAAADCHPSPGYRSPEQSWIGSVGDQPNATRATRSLQLPEPIVDGVLTDTTITSVARVVSACIECGLDSPETYRSLPLSGSDPYFQRDRYTSDSIDDDSVRLQSGLRAQLAEVEVELARLAAAVPQYQSFDHNTLVARRNELTRQLANHEYSGNQDAYPSSARPHQDTKASRDRLTQLYDRIAQLRTRQNELRRCIADVDCQVHAERNQSQDWANEHVFLCGRYHAERSQRQTELNQVTSELEACLSDAMRVRRGLQHTTTSEPASATCCHGTVAREALTRELRFIDEKLSRLTRIEWLRTRASELRQSLLSACPTAAPLAQSQSPLADAASRWLVRLSAGRLRRVSWPVAAVDHRKAPNDACRCSVQIDSRSEQQSSSTDRILAVLAVRIAAGELLGRLGRSIPLVIETTPETMRQYADNGQFPHPVVTALRDYAQSGRQVLLLTSDVSLAEQIARAGARRFHLHGVRNMQPHRPVWQPHYRHENYTGPHPHLHVDLPSDSPVYEPNGQPTHRPAYEVVGEPINHDYVNRNFDAAWQAAADVSDHVYHDHRYQEPPPRPTHRDGYFYADSYTTASPVHRTVEHQSLSRVERPEPIEQKFFLTVDSPIDQAPSVDSVAAARLRGLNVTHITHLMQQDPNRLSDALGLADVEASTIRRWQSECRLVCRVPKLRGFDARVLVGCGVTTPAQLAATHPTDLLQQVEDFLATEEGQRVLLSGSSRELSRITSWIAAANSWGVEDSSHYVEGRTLGRKTRIERNSENSISEDEDVYQYNADSEPVRYGIRSVGGSQSSRSSASRSNRSARTGERDSNNRERRSSTDRSSRSDRSGRRRRARSAERTSRDVVRMRSNEHDMETRDTKKGSPAKDQTVNTPSAGKSRRTTTSSRTTTARTSAAGNGSAAASGSASASGIGAQFDSNRQRSERQARETSNRNNQGTSAELRFYLQRSSEVVDAPSIGPRIAERLNRIGIYTVDDLVNTNPQSIANKLKHRRIDVEVITAWQQQATLVCRIPMLRGHDAQLLVLAGVTTAEKVAAQNADELFGMIDPISRSRDGKRILRGGKLPDLAEISEWIRYAKQHRTLKAA